MFNIELVPGRLACGWFLLTAIAQVWLWLLIAFTLWHAKNVYLTLAFAGYMTYICSGPGANAPSSCSWPAPLKRWFVWRLMAAYFPARLLPTAPLDPARHYLFVAHPHGILALSCWLSFATEATGFSEAFPGVEVHAATLESNFRVPLLREYILLHGLCGAGRESLKRVLSGPAGRSALLVVGGAAEALLSAPGCYGLVLRARRGFVRLALQTGASLVPVLSLGEPDVFRTHIPAPSSRAGRAIRWIKRTFGFSTPLCWGVGLFGGWGMLPLQAPLTTVVGKPLHVTRTLHPSEQQVDELHAAYTAALMQLWDEHSGKYGREVRQRLEVVQ